MVWKRRRDGNDGPTTPRGDGEKDGLPLPIIISILVVSIICLVVSEGLLHGWD